MASPPSRGAAPSSPAPRGCRPTSSSRAGAATTPGYALTFAYNRKVHGAGELCRREGIAFISVVAESLGGLHPTAVDQLRRLARGVATKTGEEGGDSLKPLAEQNLDVPHVRTELH